MAKVLEFQLEHQSFQLMPFSSLYEMVGWHHQLNGHEFEQALGVGDGGKPGVLQSLGLQRVGHNCMTELKGLREKNSRPGSPCRDMVL